MKAYQLKISFADEKPPVWKRVIVPHGITYSQLYYIIVILFDLTELYYFEEFDFQYNRINLIIHEYVEDQFSIAENSATTFIDDEFDYSKTCRLNIGNYFNHFVDFDVAFHDEADSYDAEDFHDETIWGFEADHLEELGQYQTGVNFVINIEKIIEDHNENYPVLVKSKGDDPFSSYRPAPTDDEIQEDLKTSCTITYVDEHPFPYLDDLLVSFDEFPGMHEPESDSNFMHTNDFKKLIDETIRSNATLTEFVGKSKDSLTDEETALFESEIEKISQSFAIAVEEHYNNVLDSFFDKMDWDEIVPDTFLDYLMDFQKKDLLEICKDYEINKVSNLNKPEIAAKINKALLAEDELNDRLRYLDSEELLLLKKACENNGVIKCSEDEINSACSLDAELFGRFKSTSKRFLVPKDTIVPILRIIGDDYIDYVEKCHWIEKCLFYLEWIYISAPLDVFRKIANCKDGIDISEEELLALLQDENVEGHENFVIQNNEIIHREALLAKRFMAELRIMMKGKECYIPNETDINVFFVYAYPANEPAYMRLKDFIMDICNDAQKADFLLVNIFRAISNQDRLQTVFDLMDDLEITFTGKKQITRFAELYTDASNNTRVPWNCGNKPNDIAPKPVTVKGKIKIGRNEPCPCGSGKKYKHCCGRNLN